MKMMQRGQGNLIKILSLSVGLTIGLLLIAKVCWMKNYDGYIDDADRVYQLSEYFVHDSDGETDFMQTSGGVAPMLQQQIPAIEAGTRITSMGYKTMIQLEDQSEVEAGKMFFADASYFDIFTLPILSGDAHKALGITRNAMISQRLARKIGGEVMGRQFATEDKPECKLTISGVFADFPENSSMAETDVLVALPTIGLFRYDGSMGLCGNDCYTSFVRLKPGADARQVQQLANDKLAPELPMEELRMAGYQKVEIHLNLLADVLTQDEAYSTPLMIMLIVAIVLLITAVLNYILVVISSLVSRVKGIALRKCYGTPNRYFYLTTLREALMHLLISLFVCALLISAFRTQIEELLEASVSSLFVPSTLLVLALVCGIVLVVCGLVPGYIYCHLPLKYAFGRFTESRRWWKLTLLAFQFLLSTALLSVVFVIYRQYNYMVNYDLGYNTRQMAYVKRGGDLTDQQFSALAAELRRLPFVQEAGGTYMPFCNGASGDNITLPGSHEVLFNCANLFCIEPEALRAMGMKVTHGKLYEHTDQPLTAEVMIDQQFEARLKAATGWDDVVGQKICNSSFGDNAFTISGVYQNVKLGTMMGTENRPSMCFNGYQWCNFIMVRIDNVTMSHLDALSARVEELYPGKHLQVKGYFQTVCAFYDSVQRIRNMILIGCLATLLITLVGLIGYVRDEVQRRSREFAIRRVNGAKASQLIALFVRNIVRIAAPMLLLGALIGYVGSRQVMEAFPEQIPLSWYLFASAVGIVAAIILVVITIQTCRVANDSPIRHLKAE